jgi:hypothetical protein
LEGQLREASLLRLVAPNASYGSSGAKKKNKMIGSGKSSDSHNLVRFYFQVLSTVTRCLLFFCFLRSLIVPFVLSH